MANKPQYPVYLFTGFLEGGKTKMIQEILEDENFNDGCKILLIVCEEGIEEFEPDRFWGKNVRQMVVNHPEELTAEILTDYVRNHVVDRVMIEYNGMWQLEDLYEALPPDFYIFQQILIADGSTIQNYNANMRSLVFDKLQNAETVIFNRAEGVDREALHKLVRGVSRSATIAYETAEGELEYDEIEDPLPFDINAPVIKVEDGDYALWYRDVTEEAEKYEGKTVTFKGQVAMLRRDKNGMFAPGRFVMTCCVDDIQFCGIPCRYPDSSKLEPRSWVQVTAKISAEKHVLYQGEIGPILTAIEVKPAQPANPDLATF